MQKQLSAATAFVRKLAASRAGDGARRLPSLQTLAERAKVGYATMWRAVRELRREGVLTTRRGGGIYTAGVSEPPAPPQTAPDDDTFDAWERVRSAVRNDVLSGRFVPGAPLPSQKQLAAHYGACYRTIHKALCSLADSGYLARAGRGYRVPMTASAGGRSTLVLLSRADGEGVTWQSQMSQEFLRSLERECSAHGLTLERLTHPFVYTGNLSRLRALLQTLTGRRSPPIGVLLRPHGMTAAEQELLTRELGELPYPVAWLDETGLDTPPRMHGHPSNFRMFSLPRNTDLAARMARHVLALGHRHAVYVSAVQEVDWSESRLRSLEQEFAAADGCVTPAVTSGTGKRSDEVTPNVSTALRTVLDTALRGGTDEAASTALALNRIDVEAGRLAQRAVLRAQLAPVLKQASTVRDATVWICGNDEAALVCLDYLQEAGIRVPEDLSVVGFDDSYDALCHGLTTYNFDRDGAIRGVMAYILGTTWRQQRRAGVTSIPGYVVQRSTLAPAAGTR